MLRRDGAVDTWSDHQILPGSKLNDEIRSKLESASLFIALVSPDYLASKYCYEVEFQHALHLANSGKIRIIAIILEPCDWKSSPFREFLLLPRDGKPISEWANQNNAFLDIVTNVKRLLDSMKSARPAERVRADEERPSGRRLRVRQDFDAIQRADFADKAYDVLKSYFESSCAELNEIADPNLRAKFEIMGATAFTCTVVNRGKRSGGGAHITVQNNKQGSGIFGDINFVYERYARDNKSNGSLRVEADEYNLHLVMDGFNFGRGGNEKMTARQAAETLWSDFVKKVGIDYE
jgi:hypothetical protein